MIAHAPTSVPAPEKPRFVVHLQPSGEQYTVGIEVYADNVIGAEIAHALVRVAAMFTAKAVERLPTVDEIAAKREREASNGD